MRRLVALSIALATTLVPLPLHAEHEVFYRYTVLGYVKDARGHPVKGREVTVVREKTGFSYLGATDQAGLYVVILRLGDESAGEPVTVSAGEATARIAVRFDVANRTEERGTRVDFEGARIVERVASFSSTLANFLTPAR